MNGSEGGSRSPSQSSIGSGNRSTNSNNPNAGAAAAGASYSNKNESSHHPNAAPAAGVGYANRNQSNDPNAAAAAAGAGYANRNNSYSNAGAAAAGAAYGSNYGSNQGGYWNGNYGSGMGSYGGAGMASPSYGYGSMPYLNPCVSMTGSGVGGRAAGQGQPTNNAPAGNPSGYDYSQPLNTTAAGPQPPPPSADPSTMPVAQSRQAFLAGDYAGAVQLARQALGQAPNDSDLHQFLALGLFAQGKYEQAATPLYAVLAVGPGWDWTTLIGNYAAAGVYTTQLRGLKAFVRANRRSAGAQFVEAYQHIYQGQGKAAIGPLQAVLAIQPNDGVSAQLLEKLQPQRPATLERPVAPGTLPGVWVAQAPPNAMFTLTISDEASFTWAFAAPGKSPVTIAGNYILADGVLTLSGRDAPGGPLVGKVASIDETRMRFKAVGAPSTDPGLQFAR